MSLAPRICPNKGEFIVAVGLLRFTRLNPLVASPRACKLIRSRILKFRVIERSTFLLPGPVNRFRWVLPSVPAKGTPNAPALNHAPVTAERERLGSRNGLPFRFGRSLLLPSRLTSVPVVTLKGRPLCSVMLLASCHPLTTAFKAGLVLPK